MQLDHYALGRRIQMIRKSKGLSQNALSEIIDKSPTYLSYIETGTKTMSLKTFVDIVNALETSADLLLRDSLISSVSRYDRIVPDWIGECTQEDRLLLFEIMQVVASTLTENRKRFQK